MTATTIQYRQNLWQLLPQGAHTAELGVAEGLFSKNILDWCDGKLIARHYLVDAWTMIQNATGDGGFPNVWHGKNLNKCKHRFRLDDRVVFLRGGTVDMAKHVPDDSLDLLYVDAGHTYEQVTADLNAWFPKVKQGGWIAGHDFLNRDYGVNGAAIDFANAHGFELQVIQEDKEEDAGFLIGLT